jgi:ATP-dependent Lon protease
VLPIGGLKQMVLAAHAAGLTAVARPARNRGDREDAPEDARGELLYHPLMSLDVVLAHALAPARDVASV